MYKLCWKTYMTWNRAADHFSHWHYTLNVSIWKKTKTQKGLWVHTKDLNTALSIWRKKKTQRGFMDTEYT